MAISSYAESLWKIRSGYAVLLYGSVGLVVGLVDTTNGGPTLSILCAVSLLIFGFSVFGFCMDYSFMVSKLRVVNHRDELIRLAYEKAENGSWSNKQDLITSLVNAGERKEPIDWSQRVGRGRLLIFYGGTFTACISAVTVLM